MNEFTCRDCGKEHAEEDRAKTIGNRPLCIGCQDKIRGKLKASQVFAAFTYWLRELIGGKNGTNKMR